PQLVPAAADADAVARVFAGRAGAARPALLDGVPGLVYSHAGRPVSLFRITSEDGRITAIEMVADPTTIAGITLGP
ncbi:RNA polymerase subunit sigma-70, partial [Actinomycetospora atypica]